MRLTITLAYIGLSVAGSAFVVANVGKTTAITPSSAARHLVAAAVWSAAVVYLYLSGAES